MSQTPQRIALCKTSDVNEGAAIKVETHDLALAVFNLNGAFYVTDDQCTHGPGSLSEGLICGDTVECDFHNGSFNIKTGKADRAAVHHPAEDLSGEGRERHDLYRDLRARGSCAMPSPACGEGAGEAGRMRATGRVNAR